MTSEVQTLIDQGAIFYISTSGGKDSQAMFIRLSAVIPRDQIVVVHADLGDVEHTGVQDHIAATVGDHGFHVVRAKKDFFDMVERRFETRPDVPSFPAPKYRQCTSDLKRDPIHTFIRRDLKAKGKSLAVNCVGIRAQESAARSKKDPFKLNVRLSKAGRKVYEWYPIFDMTLDEVWATIRDAGQSPHPAYAEGNERLSCVVCIMGSCNDVANARRMRPELFKRYTDLEARTGSTMFQGETLNERADRGVNLTERSQEVPCFISE